MSTMFCPHCHQSMPPEIIAGVPLPPMKADLFRYIQSHPGVSAVELSEKLYGENAGHRRSTVRSHIFQINDALTDTGVKIRGDKFVGYRVIGSSAA